MKGHCIACSYYFPLVDGERCSVCAERGYTGRRARRWKDRLVTAALVLAVAWAFYELARVGFGPDKARLEEQRQEAGR